MIEYCHSILHHGRDKTKRVILDRYWWPKMSHDVTQYVKNCITCAITKKGRNPKYGKMKLFPATRPFQQVSIDIVGPLPMDEHENRYIVTMVDSFSRYCMFVPIVNVGTMEVIKALEGWHKVFGAPKSILSDNGPQFISQLFSEYNKVNGTKLKTTTVYHPECNGQIERLHRWLKERLTLLAYDGGLDFNYNGTDNWSDYIDVIQYSYNSTPNAMTGYSPSHIVFGVNIQKPCDHHFVDTYDGTTPEEYIRYMEIRRAVIRKEAIRSQTKYDEQRKKSYDRNRKDFDLDIGDYVLHDISRKVKGSKKFIPEHQGPLEITHVDMEMNRVTVQALHGDTDAFSIPMSQIRPFKRNTNNR